MRARIVLLAATLALAGPPLALASPPNHAPAHGHRAKQKSPTPAPVKPGVEIVYDSDRGIHVAVGLKDVFFDAGHYYRLHEGSWEVSISGDGGWRVSVESKIPSAVVDARKKQKSHPGPAAKKNKKKGKRP
jgi:hypothetical protein